MFRGILKDINGNIILNMESSDKKKIEDWYDNITTPNLTLEILDLEKDRDIIIKKRLEEYPTLEEIVDAMFDGGLDEIQRKRKIVKDKYPLNNILNITADIGWKILEKTRDRYLKNTDYTQLADSPISSSEKRIYRDYRQYLRDVITWYDSKTILKAKVMTFKEWRDWKRV